MKYNLILASASPHRKEILCKTGVSFDVIYPETEEVFYKNDPIRTCTENALRKNKWCRQEYNSAGIISADTIINFNGICITKPISMNKAVDFFKAFSGKTHSVLTAIVLTLPNQPIEVNVIESFVTFQILTETVIHKYFSLVNPLDKAGAYDINQHKDLIIKSYSGSYTNIMGIPVESLSNWLSKIKL